MTEPIDDFADYIRGLRDGRNDLIVVVDKDLRDHFPVEERIFIHWEGCERVHVDCAIGYVLRLLNGHRRKND